MTSLARSPETGDPVLREVVRRLVEAYRPERLYLFGSRARGDATAESDYDVLLVVPDDYPNDRQDGRLAYSVLFGSGAAVDAVVVPRSWFEARAHLKSALPGTVLREGKLLYAA
ncbi:MAG: nucleotidyltransferase domain-containing protein [Candidatus Dormibacteria bacterium]